jgi:hypothetical protein
MAHLAEDSLVRIYLKKDKLQMFRKVPQEIPREHGAKQGSYHSSWSVRMSERRKIRTRNECRVIMQPQEIQ